MKIQCYPCPFVVDGTSYQTAEQYMMAEKAAMDGVGAAKMAAFPVNAA